jgi:hypothetical protein
MAENNNNSNGNGGADDEILARITKNIIKGKSKEDCYAFGDMIKEGKKTIFDDGLRALLGGRVESRSVRGFHRRHCASPRGVVFGRFRRR